MGGYKAKLSSWVHTFSAKGHMGFIVLFSLSSVYVILCFASPRYSIKLENFLMVIKISVRVSLPLGPLFLGHLLTRLDVLHGDEIMGELVMWSLHRRTVPSFRLSCRNVVLNTCPSARSSATLNVTSRTVLLRLLRIVANSLIRFLSSIVGLV